MANQFQVSGKNSSALFTLKIHRGDGMALLAMNWKQGKPPESFVGFAIEYKEPGSSKFYVLKNRLTFEIPGSGKDPNRFSTLRSPIQKFRWIHFPRNADLSGKFTYRVIPVFMNDLDELSYGEAQEVKIELRRETYPGKLNIAYTRGFVSSQAFVDRYGSVSKLLPAKASDGLKFVPTHPKTSEALAWMGFEARSVILDLLDKAIADKKARVCMIAYDLNEPNIVSRMKKLGSRLRIIIDNDGSHKKSGSAENQAEDILSGTAGEQNVKRQHLGKLQHNKTIAVDGPKVKMVICGSTNFSWRGLYVQNNNVLVLKGKKPVKIFFDAFDNYWNNNKVSGFSKTESADPEMIGIKGINAQVSFSPHSKSNAQLQSVADDIGKHTTSSLFYSLSFLYETPGVIMDAIEKVTNNEKLFVYGISDRKVGGIILQKPDGNLTPVYPSALSKNLPEPFKSEPTGGSGTRMHHKFIVIDFNKPSARVCMGSYNFSIPADTKNGENLLIIRNRRIAVSYAVEAISLFDHYHFRVKQKESENTKKKLILAKPPRKSGEVAWWLEDYTVKQKINDRELFA